MFWFKTTLLTVTLLLSQLSFAAGLLTPVGQTEALKIKDHQVNVTAEHSFAVIEIEQIFHNPNPKPLEAVYSFPVPDKASVGEFTYWLNGVPIHGEVLEKKAARKVYEEQKNQGRNAAIVEKNGFVDFKISVSQIPAGRDVRVKLVYIQPIEIDHGIGCFVYPQESGGTDEAQQAFWSTNEVVEQNFTFNFELNSSYPIDTFRLPAHPQAAISNSSQQQWQVALNNQPIVSHQPTQDDDQQSTVHYQPLNLDKDIVVYWRLAEGLPGSIDMMTYRAQGQQRGTFMLTLTPGNDLEALNQGRDWIVVLDHSGSMAGKYQTLLEGVRAGFKKFSANDRVKVIVFNNRATLVRDEFTPAISADLESLLQSVEHFQPEGGTNLYQAIQTALGELDSDRTSAIWLVTDGVANVGETKQQKFLSLLNKKDVRLFTFIMGNGANKPLLNGLAKASNGFAVNVSNSDDMTGLLLNAASKVNHQALRDIEVKFSGVKIGDVQPESIGSLYRGQQLVLMGHYWGDGELNVELTAKRGGEKVSYRSQFDMPKHGEQFPELERLWAFSQIENLLEKQRDFGEDADRKDAIVDLALEYGLVTDYTSMLVMEDDVFDALNIARTNSVRINKEQQARENRKVSPVTNVKVKEQQPMFNQPRATYSNSKGSGGSFSTGLVVLGLLLFGYRKYAKLKHRVQQLS